MHDVIIIAPIRSVFVAEMILARSRAGRAPRRCPGLENFEQIFCLSIKRAPRPATCECLIASFMPRIYVEPDLATITVRPENCVTDPVGLEDTCDEILGATDLLSEKLIAPLGLDLHREDGQYILMTSRYTMHLPELPSNIQCRHVCVVVHLHDACNHRWASKSRAGVSNGRS